MVTVIILGVAVLLAVPIFNIVEANYAEGGSISCKRFWAPKALCH